MKIISSAIFGCVLTIAFLSCRSDQNNYQATGNQNVSSDSVNAAAPSPQTTSAPNPPAPQSSVPATPKPERGLTQDQVKIAVNALLGDWRIGGSVSVKGIQELPQQNSAVADLQFEQFQYAVSYQGGIIKAKNFKQSAPSKQMIPSPEEMFPPRKVTYSREGKAILSHYSDGRWALKEVRWGFDTGVKGNVEIR